jgi:phage/plasmid-like protein (TIGR03299 family)
MAGVETIAFNRRASTPWDGVGSDIAADSTPEEMLTMASLDWTVSKRPVFVPLEAGSEDVSVGRLRSADIFALVRDSDNRILGPAGKDYVVTQNKQAFAFFKKFCAAGNLAMETAGSLHGGKQVWCLARLVRVLVLPGGDEIRGYLLFSSPHIWGKSLVIKFVTIRVVCANTFAMAMSESTFGKGWRMPHIRPFDAEVAKEAEKSLCIANELFDGFEVGAKKLAQAKVTDDVVVRYIADVVSPEMLVDVFGKGFYKKTEAEQAKLIVDPSSPKISATDLKSSAYDIFQSVRSQPGADLDSTKETLWGAYNAVSYYADHLAGLSRDNALESAWFGPKSVMKTKAYRRAVQLADQIPA